MSLIEDLKTQRDSWRHQAKSLANQLDRERQEWAEKLNSLKGQLDEIPRLRDQLAAFERAEAMANRRVASLERERDALADINRDAVRALEAAEEKDRDRTEELEEYESRLASVEDELQMWRTDSSNLRDALAKAWETLEFLRHAKPQHVPGRCDAAMNAIWRML